LILFATEREASVWQRARTGLALPLVVGVGPIAAAAGTADAIARLTPRRVLVCGIAGTYTPDELPVASACGFHSVRIDGIGAGRGPERLSLAAMGLAPDDRTLLAAPAGSAGAHDLLTVCSAASDATMAAERYERFACVAEDMETYACAAACAQAGVPMAVVRGISNVAGDRDHARWKVDAALDAALELTQDWLALDWELPS